MDERAFSLISEALLAVFFISFFYQGRFLCLEQRGYARTPKRAEINRMRERMDEVIRPKVG